MFCIIYELRNIRHIFVQRVKEGVEAVGGWKTSRGRRRLRMRDVARRGGGGRGYGGGHNG